MIKLEIEINKDKFQAKITAPNSTDMELGCMVAHLELMKLKLLNDMAKTVKIK